MRVVLMQPNPYHADLGPSKPMLYLEPENQHDHQTLEAIIAAYQVLGCGIASDSKRACHVEIELKYLLKADE